MAAARDFDRSGVFIIWLAAFYKNIVLLSDNFGGYDISLLTLAISDRKEGLDISTDNYKRKENLYKYFPVPQRGKSSYQIDTLSQALEQPTLFVYDSINETISL